MYCIKIKHILSKFFFRQQRNAYAYLGFKLLSNSMGGFALASVFPVNGTQKFTMLPSCSATVCSDDLISL